MRKLDGIVLVLLILVSLQVACGNFMAPEEVTEMQQEPVFQPHDPLLFELATAQAEQATQLARQEEMLQYLFTLVPRDAAAGRVDVTPIPTRYTPVAGSVTIEDDSCCAGGMVGETIELHIQFEALSPSGDITQMRYITSGAIATEDDLANVDWVDYQKEIVVEVPIRVSNWIGFWVSVQYMDAEGDVSLVYTDDISIEGMPEAPTVTP